MTQAAIAAEIHQTLDVHAGLTTKIALDDIVPRSMTSRICSTSSVAQLIDATVERDLHLFHDIGGILLADAMDVLKRNQCALVGRIFTPAIRATDFFLLSPAAHGPASFAIMIRSDQISSRC